MSLILSIDTSTSVCSIAVHKNGELLGCKELESANSHSENLTVFVQVLLKELGLEYHDIDAIAVSEGPGSYTGLRIGVSTAKGLCYSLDKPLINVKTLASLTAQALEKNNAQEGVYVPMLDARRMEVYHAVYDQLGTELHKTEPLIIDESSLESYKNSELYFFGNGSEKAREVFESKGFKWIPEVVTSAKGMGKLAYAKYQNEDFVDAAYFEPFYLKDVRITVSKKNV